MDKRGFDFHWDIKLSNGLNTTENKLFDAMKKIGLKPEPQYQISQMKVDFAFPEEMIAIEINGPHHYATEEAIMGDKKRYFVLKNRGWKLKTFSAKRVYYNSEEVAKEIKELLKSQESYAAINHKVKTKRKRKQKSIYIEEKKGFFKKEIFLNPIIFHIISLILFWVIILSLGYFLFYRNYYPNIFFFLLGEFYGLTLWENIFMYLGIYLIFGIWWLERIRRKIKE